MIYLVTYCSFLLQREKGTDEKNQREKKAKKPVRKTEAKNPEGRAEIQRKKTKCNRRGEEARINSRN